MFKTRIQMTLQPQPNNNTKMLTINMSINPKQPPPNRPHSPPKSLWKRHPQLGGERALVIDPGLDVRHERVDVFGGRHFEGFGPGGCARGVGPEVLVALAGGHCWTGGGGTEFGDGAVEHVDLVEKVDGWNALASNVLRNEEVTRMGLRGGLGTIDGEPFIQVFAFGEGDGLLQVSRAKDCGGIALQLTRLAALLHRLLGLERIPCPRISPESAKAPTTETAGTG
jgi:hypothetical protein